MQKSNLTIEVEKLKKEFYEWMRELKEREKKREKEIDKLIEDRKAAFDKLAEDRKTTGEQIKTTGEQIKAIGEQIKKTEKILNEKMGQFFDGFGDFVEGLLAPSIPHILSQVGIKVTGVRSNEKIQVNGETIEIDVTCKGEIENKKVVIAAEIKSKITVRDVDRFIRNLERFFELFDEYKGRELIGVISGVRIAKDVDKYAERRGLYVLSASNNMLKLLNKPNFKPKIWK